MASFLVLGIFTGLIYSLVAIGYTLVYGVLRLINFAHSEVLMSGAFAGYYCDFAQVVDNLVGTQKFSGAIMSGDGSDEPQFITTLSNPADGNGVLLTCACSNSQSASWTAQYTAVAHEAPGPYAAESYDAANLIMTAMAKVKGTMTRSKVLAQIKGITYKGITKTIKFDAAGDVQGTAIFVNKVEGSKIVQLGLE